MNPLPEFRARSRAHAVGIALIAMIPLLQLATEYVGTRDIGRSLSKMIVLAVGQPLLLWGSSAARRWGPLRYRGVTILLLGIAASGALFALIFWALRTFGWPSFPVLRPRLMDWTTADVLRVGFSMGITCFALWVLAWVFPLAIDDARVRTSEAERLRTEAELAQLRSSLAPHFLLNTLNAVAGLVTEDPRLARKLLSSLGDLLRESLRGEGEMQTLGDQLEWLRRYAHILEVRHSGRLAFDWKVDEATQGVLVPRLMLQPLVENAVRHGALMRPEGGGSVSVRSQVDGGNRLVCTVEDNGPGVTQGPPRTGAFGLAGVRRRLELKYSDRASLRLESSAQGTRCVVELPLQEVRA